MASEAAGILENLDMVPQVEISESLLNQGYSASEVAEILKSLDMVPQGEISESLLKHSYTASEGAEILESLDMVPQVEISESLLNHWYTALREENCVELINLLRNCRKLVWQGWKEEPKMEGKRTALLVGARRGCPDLVNKVLDIFYQNNSIQPVELADQNLSLVVGGLGELLAAKDPHYELDAMDMAVFHGNGEIVSILANASLDCGTNNPYNIHERIDWQKDTSLDEKRNKIREITELAKTEVEEKPDEADENAIPFSESSPSGTVQYKKEVQCLMEEYKKDCNFNFLPWEEYLFSFCCKFSYKQRAPHEIRRKIFNKVAESGSSLHLQDFLLRLKDGLGRTAVHIGVEARTLAYFKEGVPLGVKDGLERTAWHWTAALGVLWPERPPELSHDKFDMAAPHLKLEENWMASRYGYQSLTKVPPVQLAIIHGHESWLHLFLISWYKRGRRQPNNNQGLHPDGNHEDLFREFDIPHWRWPETTYYLGPLQLATIWGSAKMVRMLLKDGRAPDTFNKQVRLLEYMGREDFRGDLVMWVADILMRFLSPDEKPLLTSDPTKRANITFFIIRCSLITPFAIILCSLLTIPYALSWFLEKLSPKRDKVYTTLHSAFHIAAGCGNFELIKAFLEHGHKSCDIFVKDEDGNIALHHVMLGMEHDYYGHKYFKIGTKFHENVTLEQVVATRERERKKLEIVRLEGDIDIKKLASIERQGCVELLLQAGLDPWTSNHDNQIPHPGPSASPEFLSWWFDKLTKETTTAQNTLNAAANAISVTAALVATASYVGPLQPPLSYQENSSTSKPQIHMDDPLVRIFIIFDTLSFFFAVASIMMALIPSIPIPRQSARTELRRTRRIVIIAVVLLFPSIVFVLVAFAMASIAIIPQGHESWKYGGLTMTTVVVGGILCLSVIILFSLRILVVVDRTPSIRKFYDTLGF